MLKRKDWQLFRGQEGTDQDSESDTSEDEEIGRDSASTQGESSSEDADDEALESDEGEEASAVHRLEDLSEDDFEPGDRVDREALAMKESWLSASKESAAQLPKAALACRLCKGVLMLGPASLRQHLGSKRHLTRLKRKAEDYEPVYLAVDQEKGDLETHQERLQRTKEALEGAVKQNPSKKRKKCKAQPKEGPVKKRKGSKLGKRERAERTAKKTETSNIANVGTANTIKPVNPSKSQGAQDGGKRSLWSSPLPKAGALQTRKGVKERVHRQHKPRGSTALEKKVKGDAGRSEINVNRAERRRVKRERLKSAPKQQA